MVFGFEFDKQLRIQQAYPKLSEVFSAGAISWQRDSEKVHMFKNESHIIQFLKVKFDPSDKSRFLGFALEASYATAIARTIGVRNQSIYLTLLLIAVAVLASLAFASYMTRPLSQLIEASKLFSHGHFDGALPTNVKDEIGVLATSLNTMREQIQERSRALQISEARNRAIIENSVDGIITIDPYGKIRSFSPSAVRMFGYAVDEVIGKNIKMLMPSPYREKHDGYLQRFRDGGEKRIVGISREVDAQRKNGEVFPIRLAVGQITLEDEILFVGSATDISEEKSAQHEIERKSFEAQEAREIAEEAARKADRANKTKSAFLANMSHELRTPLNSLLILAHELMENVDGNLTDIQVEDAEIIYENGNDLLALINDILDLAKVESGNMQAQIEDIRVSDIVDGIDLKFRHMFAAKKIEMTVDLEAGVPEFIRSDRLRIDQVLRNFLSNALKFTGQRLGDAAHFPAGSNHDVSSSVSAAVIGHVGFVCHRHRNWHIVGTTGQGVRGLPAGRWIDHTQIWRDGLGAVHCTRTWRNCWVGKFIFKAPKGKAAPLRSTSRKICPSGNRGCDAA